MLLVDLGRAGTPNLLPPVASLCHTVVGVASVQSWRIEVVYNLSADTGVVVVWHRGNVGRRALSDERFVGEGIQGLSRPASHEERHGIAQGQA
jgi:hypothetical protein